jgi:hypothetical protein
MKNKIIGVMVVILSVCLQERAVLADEVLESIQEASEAYHEKAYSEAVESLDYAKQLIMQMSSEGLMTFLPAPMEGWQGKEAKSQNMGMLGGSSGVEKEYSASGPNNKRKRITLMIMGESPMLQGMMAMFNPAIAGANGGKLQKIKRNKAIVKYSSDQLKGEVLINVAKKYLITVKGSNVAKEELMYYAKGVDYKGLKAFQ